MSKLEIIPDSKTAIEVAIDDKVLIEPEKTNRGDGYVKPNLMGTEGEFDTPIGEVIVDLGSYYKKNTDGGFEGTVILKSEGLKSRSRKAVRKGGEEVLNGIRRIQTGHNYRGSGEQPLGKDPVSGKIRTIRVTVYKSPDL